LHGEQAAWTWTDEYLFQLFALVEVWHWQWIVAHTPKGHRPPPQPEQRRRPWEVPELKPLATREEIAAFFGASIRYTPSPQTPAGGDGATGDPGTPPAPAG
jgi:hypothetical protein